MSSEVVWDFAHVCNACPEVQVAPKSVEELQQILLTNWSRPNRRRVSILGAGFSHGGHTMASGAAIRIDMRHLNKMSCTDGGTSIVVQAGATWHQVLDYLDLKSRGLSWSPTQNGSSVAEMQSYGNFSVGGAISVNCHGRSTNFANVGDTVLCLTLQPVDGGPTITAYPESDLFRAVVGGYGGIAIIVAAELVLVPNVLLELKEVTGCAGSKGIVDALEMVHDPSVAMYNGVIYPGAETVIVHTCFKVAKPDQVNSVQAMQLPRLQSASDGSGKPVGELLLRRVPGAKQMRAWWSIASATVSSVQENSRLVWRNWELGYDATELEPWFRWPTTSILQEYFVPTGKAALFLLQLQNIVQVHSVNILNISLRHVLSTKQDPFLNYASPSEDRFALVLYINIWNTATGLENARIWTQRLVDAALHFGGTYYLPYLPFASLEQFKKAYPRVSEYRRVKKQYDPQNLLCNQFLDTYVMSF